MEISSTSKITQQFVSVSQNKTADHSRSSFQSSLISQEYKRSVEASSNIKCDENMRAKVEELLMKKILEERKKVRVMIQVLNDISKKLPLFVFNIHPTLPPRL